MATTTPNYILFAQHGWADSESAIAALAKSVAPPDTVIIAPNLGFIQTWIRIKPLIHKVEQIALDTLARYPQTPIKIIGHSMGGLIWLEVLNRNPQWWSLVDSLVLVGSPVGGADLARFFDPFSVGIGIARDLGANRRKMAEQIAAVIPTLIIAGDWDGGSDGTVSVECTKFCNAKFALLPGLHHVAMKNHPTVAAVIRDFWAEPLNPFLSKAEPDWSISLIKRLQGVMGMTDGHRRHFERSQVYITLKDGYTIRLWKNSFQVPHVFIANYDDECVYSGFVGWIHANHLLKTLEEIKQEFSGNLYR